MSVLPRIRILQHCSTDGPALIHDWLRDRNLTAQITRLDLGDVLPSRESFDWLISLGGPMNVDQEREYPWIGPEKRLIENALQDSKTVLGICLGGQMIAQVLGAKVTKNRGWEIGWHDVEFSQFPFAEKPEMRMVRLFQWHEDTFDLPSGAVRLAQSANCANQAFQYGWNTLATQFHPEVNEEWIRASLQDFPLPEPRSGIDSIQSREELLRWDDARAADAKGLLYGMLDKMRMLGG